MTDFRVTPQAAALEAAARALHREMVYPPGEDHSEHWAIYADTYRDHARMVIAAAAPLLCQPLQDENDRLRAEVGAIRDDIASAAEYSGLASLLAARLTAALAASQVGTGGAE